MDIITALPPEFPGVNGLCPKVCELLGKLIELNKWFENAFAFAAFRITTFEPGIKPQAIRSANEEEWNDILIPHEPVNLIRGRRAIRFTDVDDWNGRTSSVERTEQIYSFK